MAPGLAVQVTQGDVAAVQQLQKTVSDKVEKLVLAKQQLLNGIPFWGQSLYSENEVQQVGETMGKCKDFLEGLQAYNTPGKLKNFHPAAKEIAVHKAAFTRLAEVESLERFIREVNQVAGYLSQAESVLPDDHAWVAESKKSRADLLAEIRKPENRESEQFKSQLEKSLKKLKSEYIKAYLDLYRKARLSIAQDKEKSLLLQDERLTALRRLAAVEVINRQQLTDLEQQLGRLKTGQALTEKDLEAEPRADFWPTMEDYSVSAVTRLSNLKIELERIYNAWTQALLNDLNDPVTQNNFDLLKPAQKKMLQDFTKLTQLPDEISTDFFEALQQALSGLTKIEFDLSGLKLALFPDGSPATPEEVRKRMNEFIDKLLKGREASKVRIVIQ
jgi:Asp-tRNA(Asn)/Glu-tRNA(Gln) amidotransferase C subunit